MKTLFLSFISTLIIFTVNAQTLVAYYPFNGNANDASGNGNHGTLMNGAGFGNDRFNIANSSLRLTDATAQYVNVPYSPTLEINDQLSILVWVKRNSLNTIDEVINLGGDVNSGCHYGLVFTPGEFIFKYNGGYHLIQAPQDLNWHHYAITTYNGSADVKFYVDGIYTPTWIPQGPITFSPRTADLRIGASVYLSNNNIDELRIYKSVVPAGEILRIYQNEGLKAYYPFNGNENDATGNGYNGTINGNASFVADRFGSNNGAVTFPDKTSNISLANTQTMNLENGFTLSAWVKFKTTSNTISAIIAKHNCGSANGFIFGIDNGGQVGLWLSHSVGWGIVKTNMTFIENNWYYVTATYNSENAAAKIYIDGDLKNTATLNYSSFSSYPITIGEVYNNVCTAANMSGAIDEVRIYNIPLNDAEVLNLYEGFDRLISYYPFNGNANDVKGNFHCTVHNAELISDRKGNPNSAFSFNGNDSRLTAPINNAFNYGTGDFSITAWVALNEIKTQRVVSVGTASNNSLKGLGIGQHHLWGSGLRINYFVYSNGYHDYSSNEITGYTLGSWAFIGVVKSGTNMTFYFNGSAVGSVEMPYSGDSGDNFYIGCRRHHDDISLIEFFNGKIDEIKIYNRALTAGEMAEYALPVIFGNINVFMIDNQLKINWSVFNETNCSHYDIEVSGDGKVFKKVGAVSSKSQAGASSGSLDYDFAIPTGSLALGIALFALALLMLNNGGKGARPPKTAKMIWFAGFIFLMLAMLVPSCRKNDVRIGEKNKQVFVRIAQIDKDGSVNYSNVVKVN